MTNFHSSGLGQKVDQLMDILYAGGVNNPMDSIEQISYLLFLRLLTERDEQLAQLDKKRKRIFSGDWAKFAWGHFVTPTGSLIFTRATIKLSDPPALRAVIQGIHQMDLAAHNGDDLKGDMYEYLL